VRDKLGKPGIEWRNDDGSVTWEYTRQPEGTECFMATIGPDNILKSLENVLTPQNFARVQPGWTRDQVRRLLGKPRSVQKFALKKEECGIGACRRIQRRRVLQHPLRRRQGHRHQPLDRSKGN
jgi:hypothetical protein